MNNTQSDISICPVCHNKMTLLFQFYACDWCEGLINECWGEELSLRSDNDPSALKLIFNRANHMLMDGSAKFIKVTKNTEPTLVFPKNSLPVINSVIDKIKPRRWVETILLDINLYGLIDSPSFVIWSDIPNAMFSKTFGYKFNMPENDAVGRELRDIEINNIRSLIR